MHKLGLSVLAWIVFVVAAALEVSGDAVVRKGLRGSGWLTVLAGCLILACYAPVVNLVRWDLSKLLGVYVAVFALMSVLAGRFVLGEDIPATTWFGLGMIVLGGLVIQFGHR
ncbi:MAG TPA: hypothetical protein VG013_13345 [Gemmataceae bacterium]|jgi:small multidrug resistance family-3 protein|nr:hypothetical protein [Gemmataceae bacterium]